MSASSRRKAPARDRAAASRSSHAIPNACSHTGRESEPHSRFRRLDKRTTDVRVHPGGHRPRFAMSTVLKTALGVALGLLIVLGIGAVVLFGVVGIDPPSEGTEGLSGTEEKQVADASLAIARYCEQFAELTAGGEIPPDTVLSNALAGTDTLVSVARENPDATYMEKSMNSELDYTAIAMRAANGCLPEQANELEATLGAASRD